MNWLKTITTTTMILLTLVACNQQSNQEVQQEDLLTPIEVATVEKGSLSIEQTVYGRITLKDSATILPTQPGEIIELNVENGDDVKEGDVLARTNPGNIPIEAPRDGLIEQLTIQEGSLVSNTTPIGAVVSLNPLTIEMHATADQLNLFKKGQSIPVTINKLHKRATIEYIAVTPDDTGLYKIEAELNNLDEKVKPGMIAEAEITESKVENKIIVPTEAVLEENEQNYVFILTNDKTVRKQQVEVLVMQTESTAIEGDIKEGEKIVIKGQRTLTDGQKVEVMEGAQ